MKRLRTGIIGCGKIGDFHAKAYREIEQSQFVAVCGRELGKTKNFADKYQVKAYTDVKQMIEECDLDVVSVCTPHPLHAKAAVWAADCGCNVIIEKPLASSLQDCDQIIEAGKRNKVQIGMIVQRRYYKPSQRIKKAIEEGKIGTPSLGLVTMLGWRDRDYYDSDPWRGTLKGEGGGVLINQALHQLDLLQWYMGEVDEVYGLCSNINHDYLEVEDTAAAVIRFKNGGIGNIVVSNSQNPALYGKVHIFGSNGAGVGVQTDGGAMFLPGKSTIEEAPYNDLWTIPGEEKNSEKWKKEDNDFFTSVDATSYYHKKQIEDFITGILTQKKPFVDAKEGRKSVELFTAIYQATKTNQVIKFPFDN